MTDANLEEIAESSESGFVEEEPGWLTPKGPFAYHRTFLSQEYIDFFCSNTENKMEPGRISLGIFQASRCCR